MAKSSSNFQIILTVVFIVFAVVAVLIFAGIINVGGSKSGAAAATGKVAIWGTIPKAAMNRLLADFNQLNNGSYSVSYEEKDPATIDSDLVEALASGLGPDLVLTPNDKILKYRNFIAPIPYTSLPEATFNSTFIQEADLNLMPEGIMGFPILADPIVMYYNLDMLQSAGIALPPKTWDDVTALVPSLTARDNVTNAIKKSAVALGTYDNIDHAKDIISLLLLQAGNPIISLAGGQLQASLGNNSAGGLSGVSKSAMQYYMSFSNPAQSAYSWNKSRADSRTAFIQGDLALYFGYASELFSIQTQNPNLNFDVAMIPQLKDAQAKSTFGRMMSLAVLKSSKNITTAYIAGNQLSGADFAGKLAAVPELSLPPARRDLLSVRPTGNNQAYLLTFYNSALISKAWLDPDPTATDKIFSDMVGNISSGLETYDSAISQANDTLDLVLRTLPPMVPAQ